MERDPQGAALLRRVWLALADAQHAAGLVSKEQLVDLQAHVDDIDIERAFEIEAALKHDLMAELQIYAEQCAVGGGVLHLGATSTDILDNARSAPPARRPRLIAANVAKNFGCLGRPDCTLGGHADARLHSPAAG